MAGDTGNCPVKLKGQFWENRTSFKVKFWEFIQHFAIFFCYLTPLKLIEIIKNCNLWRKIYCKQISIQEIPKYVLVYFSANRSSGSKNERSEIKSLRDVKLQNFRQKYLAQNVVLISTYKALKDVWFFQNRYFQLLSVNYRYWLLDAKIVLQISCSVLLWRRHNE